MTTQFNDWQQIAMLMRLKRFIKKHPIKILAFALVLAWVINETISYNHSAEGHCDNGVTTANHSDEEFIKFALYPAIYIPNYRELIKQTPNIAYQNDVYKKDEFLAKYPDCCKVFRKHDESEPNMKELGNGLWNNNVVVRQLSAKSVMELRKGKAIASMDEVAYVSVDNCLARSNIIPEISPGG